MTAMTMTDWYAASLCGLDDCGKPLHAQGLCQMHYRRVRRHGSTESLARQNVPEVCTFEGCSLPHKSLDFCHKHYLRFRKYGDPNGGLWHYGEVVTYGGMHRRLQTIKGRASEHPCAHCDAVADEWAYDHNDPDELRTGIGLPYSTDPDRYIALCRSCHRTFDWPQRKERAGVQ